MDVTEPILVGTFVTLCACATLGLMVSVAFIIFHIYHRNNKIVKMSSPQINILISVGGVLASCKCILSSLDYIAKDDQKSLTLLCQVRPWVISVAVSLIFSPVAAKAWRVLQIFKYGFAKKVVIRDGRLFIIVLCVIIVDCTLLTLWQVIDPAHSRVAAYTETMADPENDTINKVNMYVVRECTCNKLEVWVAVITAWKIVIVVTCLYFAWKTRYVSVPCLNDSYNTFVAVFASVLVTFSFALVTMNLQSNPNAVYILKTVAIVTCTVLVQLVMFLPKVRYWWTTPDDTSPRISTTSLKQPMNDQLPWQLTGDVNGNMYMDEGLGDIVEENKMLKQSLLEREEKIAELQKHLDTAKEKLSALPQVPGMSLPKGMDNDTEMSSVSDGVYQTLRPPDSNKDRSELYRIDSTPRSGTDEDILPQSQDSDFSRQPSNLRYSLSLRSEGSRSFVEEFTDIAAEVHRASMINSGLRHSISRDVERYSATEWMYEGNNPNELTGSITQSYNLEENPATHQYLTSHLPRINGVFQIKRTLARRTSSSSAVSVTPSESVSNPSVDAWSLSREISLPRDSATPNSQQHADILRYYSYRHMNDGFSRFKYARRVNVTDRIPDRHHASFSQSDIPPSSPVRVCPPDVSDLYTLPNKRPKPISMEMQSDSFV